MLREKFLFEDIDSSVAVSAASIPITVISHGCEIYGRVLLPARRAEEEATPIALFLHGYPGWEQNLDIPPALRRAGIAAATFCYRGIWGSHGHYSFSHLPEDVAAVVQFLRDHAEEYHIDPERIYLIGYSMGGFAALHALADGVGARGAVLISPCDIGEIYCKDKAAYEMLMARQSLGCFNLSAPDALARETEANAAAWRFLALAEQIPPHLPIHIIGASADTTTPPELNIQPLYDALLHRKQPTSYAETMDNHSYDSHRIWLTRQVFRCITEMEQ